jgi:hypothetical protein
MADGFSDDVTSLAIETGIAADPGPCTKSEFERAQDQAKAETMLLGIYWYLYYDENVPSVLNQSWPTVWRVFHRMTEHAPLSVESAPMRKNLLDAGYTIKPEGVVGHAGLTQAAIEKLVQDGTLTTDLERRDINATMKKPIEKAANIVAKNIIRKSIGSLPDPSVILKEIQGTKAFDPHTERVLDRDPAELNDGKINQASRSQSDFCNMLDRDTLIGYLKAAQSDLGFQTQIELAKYLGVSDAMVRKAYAGKATIDTLSDYLRRCGIEVQTRPVKAAFIAENGALLTKG